MSDTHKKTAQESNQDADSQVIDIGLMFGRIWRSGGWMKHDEEVFLDDSLRIDRPGGPRTVGGENVPLDAYDGGSDVVKGKAGVFSGQWFPITAPVKGSAKL